MIALGRRNWTFAGSDAGGERTAAVYTLVQERYLADVLTKIGAGHPIRRIDGLLPWRT